MAWSKKQIIDMAFAEIGLMSYQYDMQPEDAISAVITLDSMVAGLNLPLSYNIANNPSEADANQDSGLPNWANEPIYLLLAIALCPRYGKVAAQDLKVRATQARIRLYSQTSSSVETQALKHVPTGQGNKPWNGVNLQYINEASND